MKPIDLGMTYGEPVLAKAQETSEETKHYPTFHYDGAKELDLPSEGVMTIRYKKTSSSVSQHDDRPPRYSCTVEVHAIESVEGEEHAEAPATSRSSDVESILDALMAEKLKGKY